MKPGQAALLLCFSLGFLIYEMGLLNTSWRELLAILQGKAQAVGNDDRLGGRRRRSLLALRAAGAQLTASPVQSWTFRARRLGSSPRPWRHLGVPTSLPAQWPPSSHLAGPLQPHQSAPWVQAPVPPGRPSKHLPTGTISGLGITPLAVHPEEGQNTYLIG